MKQRSNKPKPDHGGQQKPPLTAGRKWLFRIIAMLLPVLALVILEIVLRLCGYGYSTAFFKEIREGGKKYVIDNPTFSLRFFPPELARWPTSLKFPAEKSADTCRIFILGESAAMGDPEPAYGAGRYMEMLLKKRFPGRKFEVINLGITAINSHVIVPIARDCAKQHGDIWIVYMGNNEMVGPFGAATVFGSQAVPVSAVRINLAVQRTRVGQLFMSLARKLTGGSKSASWAGMQMFLNNQVPPEDVRRETVYKNFECNLRDIVDIGHDSGAKIVLSTVSVNLKDCPPFASMANSNLPAADLSQFEKLFNEGKTFESQSNFVDAADCFEKAAKLDPYFAENQFRWADCLSQMTNADAREHYQLACDYDALPFRADIRINGAIRKLAQNRSDVVFCNSEHALEAASPTHVAGDETFFEHVHFNFAGNYRLGLEWAEQVQRLLPDAASSGAATNWMSESECEQAIGLTDWNRLFVVQAVMRRFQQPPLSSQFNNAARFQALAVESRRLLQIQTQPDEASKTHDEYESLIQKSPDDPFLRAGYANFLEAVNLPQEAIVEYQRLLDLLPQDFYARLQVGRLLGEQGRFRDGESLLSQAVALRPNLPEGWYERGTVQASQGKFKEALQDYSRAAELRPTDANYVCYRAKVLAKLNRRDEAIELYRKAIQMRPGFWEAHFELAGELVGANQLNEAGKEYLTVLKLNPRHAVSHINLGVILARGNRLQEAVAQFEEALRLEPTNHAASDYLTEVQSRLNRR